ncbi:hypothetical protein GHK62_10555 [Sinorhizobium terangae]|uniref:Uncharacterized protein n=2 Tax=Sinorhizobium terangae TaxID=110322 RepID=A0A6N7LD84_SINTE|nr:hypothetical protein [Sinorhizobium terangae]MQX15188.1 hypothetical protein [Sinorhizobium terangae]
MFEAPSRTSMKVIRKAAAKNDRQKTTIQLSSISRKRAKVPPKLQTTAEPTTSATSVARP